MIHQHLPWLRSRWAAVLLPCGIIVGLALHHSPTKAISARADDFAPEGGPAAETEPRPSEKKSSPGAGGVSSSIPALGPIPLSLDFAVNGADAKQGQFTISIGVAREGESVEQLRRTYQDLEQTSRELAASLHATRHDPAIRSGLRTRLREIVDETFAVRQLLQRAEAAEFAQRLQRIQKSIELRDQFRQQIVDRRVDELLDAHLKWDAEATIDTTFKSLDKPTTTALPAADVSPPFANPLTPADERPRRPETKDGAENVTEQNLFWQALGARLAAVRRDEVRDERYRGGLKIIQVRPGGSAEQAGLQAGDILVGLGNWETVSFENLLFIFEKTAAKKTVKFHALRRNAISATLVSGTLAWDLPKAAPDGP